MRNFLKAINKHGVNISGKGFEVHENPITTAHSDNSDSRILDFRKLFIDTNHRFGLVINNNEVMFADGTKDKLPRLFKNIKEDKRARKPKVGELVEIVNCFNGNAFLTLNSASRVESANNYKGVFISCDDGICSVYAGNKLIRVPSICIKKLDSSLIGKTMKKVYEYVAVAKKKKVIISDEFLYPEITNDGTYITYITPDRLNRFDGDFWNEQLRERFGTKKKSRGVMARLFENSEEYSEEIIMNFSNSPLNVEFLEGEKVYDVFKSSNIIKNDTLGNSCMLDKNMSFFDFYRDNCKILVVKDDNRKIIARAITWDLYKDGKKTKHKLIDRIYVSNTSLLPVIKSWAMRNGYSTLRNQSMGQNYAVDKNGREFCLSPYHVKIKQLNENTYENFPYIDTFYLIAGERAYCNNGIIRAHETNGRIGRV